MNEHIFPIYSPGSKFTISSGFEVGCGWSLHNQNIPEIFPHSWFSEFDSKHAHCLPSVGAARKVSPNRSKETMTCHSSSYCFSIVWGQATAT